MLRPLSRRWRAGLAALALAAVALALILVGGDDQPAPAPSGSAGGGGEAASDATGAGGPDGGPSDDELIDRVLLVGFEGSAPSSSVLDEVADHRLGGVLVGPSNWPGAGPGRKLIAAIVAAGSKGGRTPPLIAAAQEGGAQRALGDLPPRQSELAIGNRGNPAAAAKWAAGAAKGLRRVGVNLDLAPVADVATLDSPIADRAFSDDVATVTALTVAAVKACKRAGIACAVTHFPGLGAASQDTDDGPASVGLDAGTLAARDLVPFSAAFEAGAPATVVSHAFYAYDPATPASLSTAVSTDLLRGELGFEGVAISDDLDAGAIAAVSTPGDAAVRALAAGIDLVQVSDPRQVEPARQAIAAALEDGGLSRARLREAAGRVLDLQRSLTD